ncbi:MAG: helix-turn-helix transcriptional regulator [Lachnospiraceae bacterium]|nr:helix-turn-helix transcriptional regulator [Lachnospiraceae bacterium]
MDNNFNIGNKLLNLRTTLELSQEQVALRAGITTTYYGQIERNLKNPTIHVIEEICSAFNITLEDFFHTDTLEKSHDLITEKILLQLQTCTEAEKNTIYKIIYQIQLLQNNNKSE